MFGLIECNGLVKALSTATPSRAEVMHHIEVHTREGSLFADMGPVLRRRHGIAESHTPTTRHHLA